MTLLTVLSCDGTLPSSMRCRAKLSLGTVNPAESRWASARAGWIRHWTSDLTWFDFCPSCKHRHQPLIFSFQRANEALEAARRDAAASQPVV